MLQPTIDMAHDPRRSVFWWWRAVGFCTLILTITGARSAAAEPQLTFEVGLDALAGQTVRTLSSTGYYRESGSPTYGLGARTRLSFDFPLTLGARARAGTSGLFDGRSETFLAAGVGFRRSGALGELEVAVEAGTHSTSSLTPGFLTRPVVDPSVSLPFVGGSVALTAPRPGITAFGLALFGGRDLRRERAHAEWTAFTDHDEADYEVGGWFIGVTVRLVLGPPA